MAVDFDVEDVIMKEKTDQVDKFSEDLHTGEDCDQEVPIHPVVCFFLVAEGEDSANVVFFAVVVSKVLDEAGYVTGTFVGFEGGLDRVD